MLITKKPLRFKFKKSGTENLIFATCKQFKCTRPIGNTVIIINIFIYCILNIY